MIQEIKGLPLNQNVVMAISADKKKKKKKKKKK